MAQRRVTGRFTTLERKQNSVDGNPRWRITIENGNDFADLSIESYMTKNDTALGYTLSPELAKAYSGKLVQLSLEDERIVAIREVPA